MVISNEFRLFRGTENDRDSVPNPSPKEKTTWNSLLLTKIRSKLSEYPSELCSGRENNSEICSVERKYKQTLGIPFRAIPQKRKHLNKTQQQQSLTVFKLRVLVEAVRIGFHHPG
jgi:hypothetical protein